LEVDLTLRIAHSSGDLAQFIADKGIDPLSSIGPVSRHQDQSVNIITAEVAVANSLDDILEKGVAMATAVRDIAGFPPDSTISVWLVISSKNEFTGIVVQEDIVRRAAKAQASFVFSVYSSLSTDTSVSAAK
jgi:hypothetical protein